VHLCNHSCYGNALIITHSGCVSLGLVIQQAMHMCCHIVTCGLSGCTIFFHIYLINSTIFKNLLNIECVFWFSLKGLLETFLILRRTEILPQRYISLHVKNPLFLSDFNETWIILTYFRKIFKYEISRKSMQWGPKLFHADRHDEAKSLFAIVNVPQKLCLFN
jgi:hypothetical protein